MSTEHILLLEDIAISNIKKLQKERKLRGKDIAQMMGVLPTHFSQIIKKKRTLYLKYINNLAASLKMNPQYFFLEDVPEPTHPEIKVVAPEEFRNSLGNIKANNDYMAVPIVGEIAAGNPTFIPEVDVEGFALIHVSQIAYSSDPYRYRCVWVKQGSKSMAPLIQPGSLVCIDSHQKDPQELKKKIVALIDEDGGCTIKRLKIQKKFIIGVPENLDEYEPVFIPISDQNPILGKVVWWWSKAE